MRIRQGRRIEVEITPKTESPRLQAALRFQSAVGNRAVSRLLARNESYRRHESNAPALQRALATQARAANATEAKMLLMVEQVMGSTTPPQGSVRPVAKLDHKKTGAFSHEVKLTKTTNADPGENEALFVPAGRYPAALVNEGGEIFEAPADYVPDRKKDGRRINVDVSREVEELAKDAELEHCYDIVRAYDLSLGAANSAMDDLNGQVFGKEAWTQSSAEAEALKALDDGFVSKVAALKGGQPPKLKGPDDPVLDTAYQTLHEKSPRARDDTTYHTMEPDKRNRKAIMDDQNELRDMIPGPQFKSPGEHPKDVINY